MSKQQAELHNQSIRCSNQPRNAKTNKQQAELQTKASDVQMNHEISK
jgi:hypothetical protein